VPEARDGEGWRMFLSELRLVVKLFQSLSAARSSLGVGKS
jgi:hypothetical protein